MTIVTATFGAGCFWCIESAFMQLKGVNSVISGYSGGDSINPTYETLCQGNTGHAEVIEIQFDDDIIDYQQLLTVFFSLHDPTTLNRQGNDIGTQYRSIILFHSQAQQQQAINMITALDKQGSFNAKIVTSVEPFKVFYPAEDYHQQYVQNNPNTPYCSVVISPKLAKFKKQFSKLLKD